MADPVRFLPALLPVAAIVLCVLAFRPRGADVVAPWRLAVLRAGVAVGAVAVCGVELLSAMRHVDGPSIAIFWVLVVVAAAGIVVWRRPSLPRPELSRRWRELRVAERAMLVAMAGIVVAELVLALASAPNNYDSNYYHLPKVEHWVADHDVDVFPTAQLQLVTFVPGTEYLLLHLRLLTGTDGIYNLVQWLAGIGAAIAVSRVAAQLGSGRLGQWIAGALVVGTPMVVLQATSTQTDLAVSAWLMCAASLALDGFLRRTGGADVLALGAASGLVAITKSTGLMGLAPVLLLWGVGQLRQRELLRTAGKALAVVVVGLLVVGPFMLRMERTFGSPLGSAEYNKGLQMERHDPPALVVNALRMLTSTLVVPVPAINTAVADGVIDLSHALGVDPDAESITVGIQGYPDPRWWPDEDHSPYPIPSVLVLLAVGASLLARRVPLPVRAYAGAVLVDLLLTVWVLKWQLWGNRLLLAQLMLGLPLAGWWLGRVTVRFLRAAVAVVVAASLFWGYDAVLLGRPRRLVGHGSVFSQSGWTQRFARQPDRRATYETAAGLVRRTGTHRVGTVVLSDQWEYPLWKLLPGRDFVSLASDVPREPPASPASVGAIVCVAPAEDCTPYVPVGWTYTQVDPLLAVILPPTG